MLHLNWGNLMILSDNIGPFVYSLEDLRLLYFPRAVQNLFTIVALHKEITLYLGVLRNCQNFYGEDFVLTLSGSLH